MWQKITSVSNPHIREIIRLMNKPAERIDKGWVIVEGLREIRMALNFPMQALEFIVCPEVCLENEVKELEPKFISALNIEVSIEVFSRLAYRENKDGVIAIFKVDIPSLASLHLPPNPLILVLESIEKPGNLGAILRTADAAGCDALIVCDPRTDIFNPNVIRASLGTVFSVPLAVAESKETMHWLENHQVHSFAAALMDKARPYTQMDYTKNTAIVLGSEAEGLSKSWLQYCQNKIIIPMRGKVDSLNVSVAAAVIIFEAVRQRSQSNNA